MDSSAYQARQIDRLLFVCRCLRITEPQLRAALEQGDIHTLKELRRQTGAGDGCMGCHKLLEAFIEQRTAAAPYPSSSSSSDPICSAR